MEQSHFTLIPREGWGWQGSERHNTWGWEEMHDICRAGAHHLWDAHVCFSLLPFLAPFEMSGKQRNPLLEQPVHFLKMNYWLKRKQKKVKLNQLIPSRFWQQNRISTTINQLIVSMNRNILKSIPY